MTTGELSARDEPAGALEAAEVLKRLQDSALGLLAGLERAPRSLRIKADQVEIEMEWPDHDQVGHSANGTVSIVRAEPLHLAQSGGTERYVTAHMVGVFYRSPEPGAKPFVDVGDVVVPGQQVGIIEAMKLMIPVEADTAGRVVEVLVHDGASVEYGDRLFAIEPADD